MKKYIIDKNANKKELVSAYNKMVGTANKSLYRLEQYSNQVGFENITKYAYATALRDIWKRDPEAFRFRKVNENMSKQEIQSNVNSILRFLNSPTRTKTGIKEVYQNRADTLNQRYGTNLKWQNLSDYFASANNKKIAQKYGSKTALKMQGKFEEKSIDELEDIYRSMNKNRKLKKYEDKEELIQNIMLHKNQTMRNLNNIL